MYRSLLIGLALVQAIAVVSAGAARQATPEPEPGLAACQLPQALEDPWAVTDGISRAVLANDIPEAFVGEDFRCTLRLHRVTVKAGGAASPIVYPPVISYVEAGRLMFEIYEGQAIVTWREGQQEIVDGTAEGSLVDLRAGDVIFLENARYTVYVFDEISEDGEIEKAGPAIVLNAVIEREEGACPPCPMWP
jgi:hypothetical protein